MSHLSLTERVHKAKKTYRFVRAVAKKVVKTVHRAAKKVVKAVKYVARTYLKVVKTVHKVAKKVTKAATKKVSRSVKRVVKEVKKHSKVITTALTVVSFLPVVGQFASAGLAVAYYLQGDTQAAIASLLGVVAGGLASRAYTASLKGFSNGKLGDFLGREFAAGPVGFATDEVAKSV